MYGQVELRTLARFTFLCDALFGSAGDLSDLRRAHGSRKGPNMAGELLALRGEIDIATADAFRSDLYACVDRADLPIAFIDLEAVTFMDSAGYHALVDAMDHALERGRIIVFRNLSSKCLRVVSICDVDRELRVEA